MASSSTIPGTLNLTMIEGDEFSRLLEFSESSAAKNLTGYTFAASVTADGVDTSMTVTNTSLVAGQITISMTETQTAALSVGTHKWRLKWTAPGSVLRTVLSGTFTVQAA